MKRWLLGICCVALSCAALAAGPNVVRKRAQASMLVTGTIEVAPDGSVHGYALDQADKLPPGVVGLIGKDVPAWTFQPVLIDGKPVLAKAKMSLRIVAKRVDDEHASISITGAQFGQQGGVAGETTSYKTRPAPKYPWMEQQARVSGTVYLLLRVGRNGQVEDAAAEQVNLAVYASDSDMERFRDDLAKAALAAATHWTFNTPTKGKHASDDHWVARVPVNFQMTPFGGPQPEEAYGKWQSYIPGPHALVPWMIEKDKLISGEVDAIPAGSIYQVDEGFRLTTPLGGA